MLTTLLSGGHAVIPNRRAHSPLASTVRPNASRSVSNCLLLSLGPSQVIEWIKGSVSIVPPHDLSKMPHAPRVVNVSFEVGDPWARRLGDLDDGRAVSRRNAVKGRYPTTARTTDWKLVSRNLAPCFPLPLTKTPLNKRATPASEKSSPAIGILDVKRVVAARSDIGVVDTTSRSYVATLLQDES